MPYPVIRRIPGDCREAKKAKENAYIQGTRGGKRPGSKEERIPGQYRRNYEPGLAKDDEEKDQVGPYSVIMYNNGKVFVQMHKDIEECLYQFHTVTDILHEAAGFC